MSGRYARNASALIAASNAACCTRCMIRRSMPAKTKRQQRFMGMCANPKTRGKARKKCPPKKVARKYARKPK